MANAHDAVVIGGGPAGLAGALWLARYRLDVKLFDRGDPRNAPTRAVHGYLGLDDVDPFELRRVGWAQAAAAGARLEAATVEGVSGTGEDFTLRLDDGGTTRARRLLFATGLRDIVPEIPGLRECYGSSIWHCPDCDGPSVQDARIVVIGWGRQIAAFCMEMLTWTEHITLLTHGHDPRLPGTAARALERFDIAVRTEPVVRIEGSDGRMRRAVLAGGDAVEAEAAFFHIAWGPGSSLPAELGCAADEDGILRVDSDFRTSVSGVYAAGDIVHGSKLAIHAAADGTRAAIGIYRSLLPADRRV